MPIQIAVVDDKLQNRASLKERIVQTGEIEVIISASNGKEFLEEMKLAEKDRKPSVVLMDIDMPVMDGIEAVSKASEMYPETKFLMLTVFDDDDKIFDAIRAGAVGYFLKDEKIENLIQGIKDTLDVGGSPMSPRIARKALNLLMNSKVEITKPEADDSNLSEREKEILKLMVEGHDYKAVAEKLFISPHTVRKHIANIYEKLHVTSKVQAVRLAIKKKWFMLF
ncbi:MAG: response regulator transcription factor [Flavobacteriales bacterium]|nr:response regulator transcription factor [Flavobacteriales bacterium]